MPCDIYCQPNEAPAAAVVGEAVVESRTSKVGMTTFRCATAAAAAESVGGVRNCFFPTIINIISRKHSSLARRKIGKAFHEKAKESS